MVRPGSCHIEDINRDRGQKTSPGHQVKQRIGVAIALGRKSGPGAENQGRRCRNNAQRGVVSHDFAHPYQTQVGSIKPE